MIRRFVKTLVMGTSIVLSGALLKYVWNKYHNEQMQQHKVIAGFPEFWQKAHDKYPLFFKAAKELMPLENEIFKKPASEPLHKVLRHIAKIVSNSLGALITLVLNGYGNDAMKIARGMFEGAVTVGYLKGHPEQVEDYLDFHWIRQKRLYDYMKKSDPDLLQRVSPEKIAEMKRQLAVVAPRFTGSRGKLRNSWSKVKLRQMAEEVGLGDLYPTFYSFASSMHHIDIGGLFSQAEDETLDVDVAPSDKWLGDALIIGHNTVLHVLHDYNEVAQLGFDKELEKAFSAFQVAWQKGAASQ